MKTHASLLIIGAGIVGCSTAWHLVKKGFTDILVIDQGPLFATGGSTSHAPGLVFQTNGSQTMCVLAQRTVAFYNSLSLDGQPGFYPVGSIEVAQSAERMEDLKRRRGFAASWGLKGELLTPEQVAEKAPVVDPAAILGGYFVPSDGIAKALRLCEAMGRSCRAAGVEFVGEAAIEGFDIRDGQVYGVQTAVGAFTAERILMCGGIWGPKLGRLAGVPIPLMPVEHQLTWSNPLPSLAGVTAEVEHPLLRNQDKAMYFRQVGDKYAIGSYQHAPLLVESSAIRSWADSPVMPSVREWTPAHFEKPWRDAVALIPELAEAGQGDYRINGMFSFTTDSNPVMGETHVKNLWVAEAVWVTHAGGVGRAMADLLADGRTDLDLRECDVARFEPHHIAPSYVRARGAQQYREVYDIIHPLQGMEDPRPLRTSPFYPFQQQMGGVFYEARGWERPQWYEANKPLVNSGPEWLRKARTGWESRFWSPIVGAEHLATRERVALYDLTSLTRCEVSGPGALALLQRLSTGQIDRPVGSVVYTCLCDEQGGVKSDVTIARLGAHHFQVAVNGLQDIAYLRTASPADGSVSVCDITSGTCCVGVWGPLAREVVQPLTDADLSNGAFPYFSARQFFVREVPVTALRLSYVGELGWELYTTPDYGYRLWQLLWQSGQRHGIIAGGRGAFDSLRLEKGYRLWGADMQTEYNAYEAGLGFTVKLDKGDFVGRDALARVKAGGVKRKLCCLLLDDPATVVMGKEPIWAGGEVVGYVTSATYGYSVRQSFAYGYLPVALTRPGSRVEIEYFGRSLEAVVSEEPLFDAKGARVRG
jgi:glycine cleavage system aminomethyltransferase T/glycine/D-amino acid oxidase-like deaminating enzyme